MRIPPTYSITPEMTRLITKIESYRMYLSSLEIPEQIKEKIQRVSLLKSSLFSAKIEGNTLELTDFEQELAKKVQIFLPPRQEEIYSIIKDHKVVSFDMIRRRFLKVPERTLRYDLKKLSEKNVIEKTGETKGRYYRINK